MRVRSEEATALRIWLRIGRSRWSCRAGPGSGAAPGTRPDTRPAPTLSSSRSIWWTEVRARRSGAVTSTRSSAAAATAARSPVQPRPLQARAAVAVVAEAVLRAQLPALRQVGGPVRPQAFQLLAAQCSGPPPGAPSRRAHPRRSAGATSGSSAVRSALGCPQSPPAGRPPRWPPTPGSPGRRGPSGAARPGARTSVGAHVCRRTRLSAHTSVGARATACSSLPPR